MNASARRDKIGYARVSAPDQKLDSQFDALKQAGCDKTFSDQVSGAESGSPRLEATDGLYTDGRSSDRHGAEPDVTLAHTSARNRARLRTTRS